MAQRMIGKTSRNACGEMTKKEIIMGVQGLDNECFLSANFPPNLIKTFCAYSHIP